MLSSKRMASRKEVALIMRFFKHLFAGKTVHGFNDKMVNLRGDERARNCAMAHIIDTYLVRRSQIKPLLK